jgi:hypothetical protein
MSKLVVLLSVALLGLSGGLLHASCATQECTTFSLLGLYLSPPTYSYYYGTEYQVTTAFDIYSADDVQGGTKVQDGTVQAAPAHYSTAPAPTAAARLITVRTP